MFDLFAYFKFYLGITPISQCRLFHRSYRPCVSFSMMKVGIKRLQYIPSEAALYINVETQWEIESYCSIPRTQEKSYSDEMNTHATHNCTMFHSASLRQYYKMCSKVIHFHFDSNVWSFMFSFIHSFSDGKESACNAGDLGSIPGLGRSLEREWQPTPVFLPG